MEEHVKYKWKMGYAMADVKSVDPLYFEWLKEKALSCENFILGIPDRDILSKLYKNINNYDPEWVKKYWLEIKWVDDVIILDMEHLDYQKMYEQISYDVCFYGSRYGREFEKDRTFMKEHGVDFEQLMPERLMLTEGLNAIEEPLTQTYRHKKLVLFGTGAYFDAFMRNFGEKYKPKYAIDNDKTKWGTFKEGITIKNPNTLLQENRENILIVICSKNYQSILQQLQELGEYDYRLMLYYNEVAVLEEIRYIDTLDVDKLVLDRIHEINLEMLSSFNGICKAHGVQYYLNYGSCLGAIRHKGFIPWDNDIDVCMTRENYEKLELWKNEFEDKYHFVLPNELGNKKYFDCVPRLNYKKAYIRMDEDATKYYENHNNRIDLDMFLIDKTYDDFKGKFQRFELAVLYGMMNAYRHESSFFDYSKGMKIANAILRSIGRCLSLNWLRKRVDKVAKRFDKDPNAPFYVITNCALCKLKLLFPVEIFNTSVEVPFENLQVPVPGDYDAFLRLIFGNYMNLPLEEERVPHWGRILISADTFVFEEPTSTI